MLMAQVGPVQPGKHLHLNLPNCNGTQSAPCLHGLSIKHGSTICEQSGPVKPVLQKKFF